MKNCKKAMPSKGKFVALMTIGILGAMGGVACSVAALIWPEPEVVQVEFPDISLRVEKPAVYSSLTGLEITADEKTAPTYCIQTPNGMDGARPQAGLDQAGVVFEAIAEAGITRFAAIYQNPSSAVIGPIRSLRLYYLQWDTPFDCTIVHAGGADDALAAVRSGGYKDLTENYTYMYRGTVGSRRWNNLFTTATLLAQMNADRGYGGSEINGFTRMTPDTAKQDLIDKNVAEKLVITEAADKDVAELVPTASSVAVRFGWVESFNVNYNYDAGSNSYRRSFANGTAHEVYACPESDLGEVNPESACVLEQLSPSVVVAIVVEEKKAWDNYHEDITTVGSGVAYVFQNGYAVKGQWVKKSVGDQLRFYDESGAEVALVPGQTFIEAVPSYGDVDY